jgi:hypothetical protein
MDCERIKPLLSGFLYKDLEEGEKQIVQAHLGECTDCQDDILSLKKTKEVLECWPDEEVSSQMVFIGDPKPWYRRISLPVPSLDRLRLRPLRTASFALAATFLLLAVGNTRVSYRQGDFSLDFSLLPRQAATDENAPDYASLQQDQQKQLETVNNLIRESESRQMEELDRRLRQAVLAMESRRQQDLLQVGQAMDQMRNETGTSLAKTQRIMNDLIVLTGSGDPVMPGRISR